MSIPAQGQHICVVGLGKTGISAVAFLRKQGFKVTALDTRVNPPGLEEVKAHYPEVPLYLGELPLDILKTAKLIVLSPGLSIHHPALEACEALKIPIFSDIELFSHYHKGPVLGITGSNGKSTVTMLVAHILKGAGVPSKMGGNIGIPVLDLLPMDSHESAVLELSSFQLDSTESLCVSVACILNITPDHMDRYATFDDYVNSKHRIYKHCTKAVVNRDEPITMPKDKNIPVVSYGLSEPKAGEYGIRTENNTVWLVRGDTKIVDTARLKLAGKHNWANVLASIAMVEQFNIPLQTLRDLLESFTGLPYRCEWRAELKGVPWYNDSKGTNVGATLAAIQGLAHDNSKNIILIAGGQGKGADFSCLQDSVGKHVKMAVLYGEDGHKIQQGIEHHTAIHKAHTLEEAVNLAHDKSQKGDVVLFSPACASFDMFKNFEHRGDVFNQLVKGLEP